jgi:TldD protein
MKDIASWALETAKLRGASHAEARIVDERSRSLATKNGRIAGASDSESMGIGIRVIANGGCRAKALKAAPPERLRLPGHRRA